MKLEFGLEMGSFLNEKISVMIWERIFCSFALFAWWSVLIGCETQFVPRIIVELWREMKLKLKLKLRIINFRGFCWKPHRFQLVMYHASTGADRTK